MAATETESSIRTLMETRTKDFLMCYEDASTANDVNFISRHLAKNCKRYLGPLGILEAMGLPQSPEMSVAEYQAAYDRHLPIWKVKSTDISNIVIDTAERKAAARSICHGEFTDGTKVSMDFTWFLDFNEDGTEIKKVLEFVDVPGTLRHLEKDKEIHEQLEAEST